MKAKRIGFISLAVVVCAVAGFLFWPSNYYLRRAIVHLTPTIDQHSIFVNRIVKAGDPKSWQRAEGYNTLSVPPEYVDSFAKYETVAFVVIKDNKLLFDEYWEDFTSKSQSNSFSMAKSLVALAIGCAIDDGVIKSVDQPVSDFFPEFKGFNGKALTIRHLLTMSAGVDFEEAYTSPFSSTTKLYYGDDLRKVTFNMKEIEEPGVNFIYQSGVTQLLAFVLEKATGKKISNYISEKFWTPMHAEESALWSLDKKGGMEKAYCCFNTNARDFARIGQLLLNNGAWDGKQLVSKDYLREALTPDTKLWDKEYNAPNTTYGFQFWYLNYKGMDVNYMRGIMGQYIFAIPDKNAVIVRLGKKRSETHTSQYYPEDIDIWLAAGLEIIKRANMQELK